MTNEIKNISHLPNGFFKSGDFHQGRVIYVDKELIVFHIEGLGLFETCSKNWPDQEKKLRLLVKSALRCSEKECYKLNDYWILFLTKFAISSFVMMEFDIGEHGKFVDLQKFHEV